MTHEQRAAAVAKMHALKGADECALVLHGLRCERDWEDYFNNTYRPDLVP